MPANNSSRVQTTSSAAADGVGARRSATKSAIVTSVSCPMADTTGTARKPRERPLPRRFEQTLGSQFLFELLEGELQRTMPLGLQKFDEELVFAARFEYINPPARHHRNPVLRLEFQIPVARTETNA